MKFKKYRIGQLGKVVTGKTPSTKNLDYWSGEFPFITIPDLNNSPYIRKSARTLSQLGAASIQNQLLPANTVLMSCIATVGKCGITTQPSFTNQQINAVIPNSLIEPKFMYYLFRNLGAEMARFGSGGTVYLNISKSLFESMEVSIPTSIEIQAAISNILEVLDSKIENNNALSKTLEDIAQTIFKSWFIDFDPVKAKMNGEKPIGMDDETAALFPDSFEQSELGLIPKGWEVGTIKDICQQVVNGSTPLRTKGEFWADGEIDWYKTGELSDNFLFESKERISIVALEKTSVKVLPKGSVLMAIYAAPTVGRLGILTKESTFNQASTGMVAIENFGTPYLYLTLFNKRDWFNSLAIGAAQQNISKVIVESCPTLIANEEVHASFLKFTKSVFEGIEFLAGQSNTLKVIRDSLLPRLISGELQIPEEMLAS